MATIEPVQSLHKDKLTVNIYHNDSQMGNAAAGVVVNKLQSAIAEKGSANLILATGASQFSFLNALRDADLDWQKIIVFHLDEYKDMSDQHPASFRKYLRERILDHVQPFQVHYLEGDAKDIDAEIHRYESLLRSHPVDVACIGIGENGHIAFNDPPVADFNDPHLVKVVELDEPCRQQQLGEGWFGSLAEVPTHALSLTIPAIMNCRFISCVVPDERKADAVYNTLNGPVATACPASILRTHANAILYLDQASAKRIWNND